MDSNENLTKLEADVHAGQPSGKFVWVHGYRWLLLPLLIIAKIGPMPVYACGPATLTLMVLITHTLVIATVCAFVSLML